MSMLLGMEARVKGGKVEEEGVEEKVGVRR